MSTIVRTTLSLVPSLVSGYTYNASTTAKLRQHGFAESEDDELAIGLLFVEALKQVRYESDNPSFLGISSLHLMMDLPSNILALLYVPMKRKRIIFPPRYTEFLSAGFFKLTF